MPGIALSSDSIDNPNKFAAIIEEAFEEADVETGDINIHTGTYCEGWSSDEPCPHCGGERFHVPTVNDETYVLDEDGHLVFEEKGDDVGPMLGFFCDGCDKLIKQVPYEELL